MADVHAIEVTDGEYGVLGCCLRKAAKNEHGGALPRRKRKGLNYNGFSAVYEQQKRLNSCAGKGFDR